LTLLPARVRRLTPKRLRDNFQLRTVAVGIGLIPPRRMHSAEDARVLRQTAHGALRAVEIGVYEGASARALLRALAPSAELHLIDPFGAQPDALPEGWRASEWATRRVLKRAARRLRGRAPRVVWHVATSETVASHWSGEVDLVFVDGDHSEAGCELDWSRWHAFVSPGGYVVFHDARADQPGGRGLPGPTAVVKRHFRASGQPGWKIAAEADRTVAVRRLL
jgi:predicted O-methyltransferase YrrM